MQDQDAKQRLPSGVITIAFLDQQASNESDNNKINKNSLALTNTFVSN